MNLSPGAEAAWMIAAGEAAAAGHDLIEPAHLLIGSSASSPPRRGGRLGTNAGLVRDENARLLKGLSSCGIEATRLRRRARSQLGRGPVQGPPKGPLSRSLTCKAVFAAAADLAGEGQGIGIAHLIAAPADDVDVVTSRIIRSAGAITKLRACSGRQGPDVFGMGPAAVALDRAGRDGTLETLRELRPRLEKERSVSITEEALSAAIDLSMRFEPERKLPEKAIELVEHAAERTSPSPGGRGGEALVTPLTIAKVLAERRRLPLDLVTDTLDSGMGGRILALEDYLRERVLGQEEAIGRVGRRLRQALTTPSNGGTAPCCLVGERRQQDRDGAAPGRHLFARPPGIRMDMSGARDGIRRAPHRATQGPSVAERKAGSRDRESPRRCCCSTSRRPIRVQVFLKLFGEARSRMQRAASPTRENRVVVMTSNPGTAGRPDRRRAASLLELEL